MAYLSANTLFHFTPKLKWLFGVLENGFIPRYSLERSLSPGTSEHPVHLPMVCFCDIRLSEVEKHQKIYGQYGIGMEKNWAVKKGINPVYYINRESLFRARFEDYYRGTFNALIELYHLSIEAQSEDSIQYMANGEPYQSRRYSPGLDATNVERKYKAFNEASSMLSEFMGLFNHFKERVGNYERYKKIYKSYQYYDEKEWRYVPAKLISEESALSKKYSILYGHGGNLTAEEKNH